MSVVTTRKEDGVLVVSANNPPVNALSRAVRLGLMAAALEAARDGEVKAVVLRCEGRTFHAGADITEFGSKAVSDPGLREVVEAIEACPKPFVAALHGTAFGGGL
ncbi:MAG TPA: enoyl-CoA hydratase-related protein, partial [Terricaulis sp.]|nr:enoyl-CoA hydratase-related protein [Terricaulis sp.]